MQDFTFQDETFDQNRSSEYQLLIRFSAPGITTAILDADRNKFIVLAHQQIKEACVGDLWIEEVERTLEQNPYFNSTYKSTRVLYLEHRSILVPDSFCDPANVKLLLSLNHPLDEYDELHLNAIEAEKATVVYPASNAIINLFIKKQNKATFYHQSVPLIHSLVEQAAKGATLAIHRHGEYLDVAIAISARLKLFNTFYCQGEQDVVYYIMATLKQLFLNPDDTPILISGEITQGDSIHLLLQQYCKQLRFLKLPDTFSYSYTFYKVPQHHFFGLYYLAVCAS